MRGEQQQPVAITGVGMLTPVGLRAYACLHAVRCGLSRFSPQPFRDRAKGWIVGGRVMAWLPNAGVQRLAALADAAIGQALEQARWTSSHRLALVLCSTEDDRPGPRLADNHDALQAALGADRLSLFSRTEILHDGAAGFALALDHAQRMLHAGEVEACIIGSADSQLDIRVTRWLEDAGRLKCRHANDGRIPSEAAAFVVVEHPERARLRRAPVLAVVGGFSMAWTVRSGGGQVLRATRACTEAVRATLAAAALTPAEVGMVWSDLNGESARGLEWGLASVRMGLACSESLFHPADCWGDLGAASGCALLGLGAMAQATGWAGGKPLLVTVGNEGPGRAGCVVLPPPRDAGLVQVSHRAPRIYRLDYRIGTTTEIPPAAAIDPLRGRFQEQMTAEIGDTLAGLHHQHAALLHAADSRWQDRARVEQRMLNHLDAVVAGGTQAMAHVADLCMSGDAGLVFAASLLIGSLPHPDNLRRLESALAASTDPAVLDGVKAGLAHAPRSAQLSDLLQRWTLDPQASVRMLALQLICLRCETQVAVPHAVLSDESPGVRAWGVELLGRRRKLNAETLRTLIGTQEGDLQRRALLALLRLDPAVAAHVARAQIEQAPDTGASLTMSLALAGQSGDGALLRDLAARHQSPDAILALGVYGEPAAVPTLMAFLEHDAPLAASAAHALRIVSGLRVDEDVRVERAVDLLGGETTTVIEAQHRPSQSRELWAAWWSEALPKVAQSRMRRMRQGRPFSLDTCLAEIEHPDSANVDRSRAALELDIHGAVAIPPDVEWFVARQALVLRKLRAQLQAEL
ncbi:hypothetical protein GCM10007320_64410 [Pseudorhodoferax aquiterrae]|uniref:3-oxoacyl-ACP synthase n=2 Tax=Pseudorhodoferax aquiterrae TaxID=747304 RepID=A0ABQ3GFX7_9BURK|nr:hypothetical protein GCM10007320_64410 [Pseudorhodoferax aquiterrae]